jgi:hypothetical protein
MFHVEQGEGRVSRGTAEEMLCIDEQSRVGEAGTEV